EPRSLMNELVERMLSIGPRLAPENWPGLIVDSGSTQRHVLAVALHRQLLQVRRESLQILLVRKHRDSLRSEEIAVPDCEQTQDRRQIVLEGRCTEVLIHSVEAVQHGAKVLRTNGEHGGKTDCGIH